MKNRRIDEMVLGKIKGSTSAADEKVSLIIYAKKIDKNLSNILTSCDCEVKYKLSGINAYAVDVPAKNINELAKIRQISYIAHDAKADTCLNIARAAVGAEYAHGVGLDGENICIAVLDTGLYPHNDIILRKKGEVKAFADFINGRTKLYDDNGHGTHVCGIIASNGMSSGGRYKGVAPAADLVVVKIMDKNGGGLISDIAAGIEWVIENKEKYNIRIASMSLGVENSNGRNDALMQEAEQMWDHDIAVFAAAGNNGPKSRSINSPGTSSKIITVGCVDDMRTVPMHDDKIAEFSSRGPAGRLSKPDVVAPGVDIISLLNTQRRYTKMSGTSMATPMAAGIAALMLQKKPELTPNKIKQMMMSNTFALNEGAHAQGRGEIDMVKILKML